MPADFASGEPTDWISGYVREGGYEGDDAETLIRGTWGRLLFKGDDVKKSVKVISGGEQGRMLFGKLMLQRKNVLLLDEPTNHMDMESIESLNSGIADFTGTLFFVSHDRPSCRPSPPASSRSVALATSSITAAPTRNTSPAKASTGAGPRISAGVRVRVRPDATLKPVIRPPSSFSPFCWVWWRIATAGRGAAPGEPVGVASVRCADGPGGGLRLRLLACLLIATVARGAVPWCGAVRLSARQSAPFVPPGHVLPTGWACSGRAPARKGS